MPLVKHKCGGGGGGGGGSGGSGGKLKNILCDVFLLLIFVVLLQLMNCVVTNAAKIETPIDSDKQPPRALRDNTDDMTIPSTISPINNRYEMYNDFDKISSDAIHRIMRDENEPNNYRNEDIRLLKNIQTNIANKMKQLKKRSIDLENSMKFNKSDKNFKIVNLTDSNLNEFSEENLVLKNVSFDKVIELYLNENNLNKFQCDSINKLIALESLDLSNNNLNEFIINDNLIIKKLNLTNNHLKIFNAIINEKLFKLENLDLSNNNLSEFELSDESVIKVLNLSNNNLNNFITLLNNTHLTDLDLKNNNLNSMNKINLTQLNGLESLDLSYNRLDIFHSRNQLKTLKRLDLSGNYLSGIYKDTFSNLLNMETLILLGNNIDVIDIEAFLVLPNLQYLDLSHNRIQGDSIRALQGVPDLVGLSIAYNMNLDDTMLQEFVASWSLKELDASGTGLCRIPAALAQSVRALKLVDNWFTTINCGDLDSYPLLQYLDLSNSHIQDIEEDALGRLEILETLFLDHNKLRHVPISLPTSLENLFLQNNQIMEIQTQTFQGLKNLKILDLSGNHLIYVPDLPLPKLLVLNLQSSELKGLSQLIVQTSPHLRDLLLDHNPIKCSDLLGIAEWASPCRNDRIPEPTNIKQSFLQTQNYFKQFTSSEKNYETFQQKQHKNNEIKITKPKCADKSLTDIKRQNSKRIEGIDRSGQVLSTVIFDYNQSIKTLPTTAATITSTRNKIKNENKNKNENKTNLITINRKSSENNDVQSTTFATTISTSTPVNSLIFSTKIITDELNKPTTVVQQTTSQPKNILDSYQDVTLNKGSIDKKTINNITENVQHSNAKLSTLSPLYNFMANMKTTNSTIYQAATTKTFVNRANIGNNNKTKFNNGNMKLRMEKQKSGPKLKQEQNEKSKENFSKIKTDNNYITTTISSQTKSQETNDNNNKTYQYHQQQPTTTKGLIIPDAQIKDIHVSSAKDITLSLVSSTFLPQTPPTSSSSSSTPLQVVDSVDKEYNEEDDDNEDDSDDLAQSLPKNYEKNNSLSLDKAGKQSLYKIDEILIRDRHLFGTPLVVNKGHTLVAATNIERNSMAPAVVIMNDKKTNNIGTEIDRKGLNNSNPTIETIIMNIVKTTTINKLDKFLETRKINEINQNSIIKKDQHDTEGILHHSQDNLFIKSDSNLQTISQTLIEPNSITESPNISKQSDIKNENISFQGSSTVSVKRTFELMMQNQQNNNQSRQLLGSTSPSLLSSSSSSSLSYGIIHEFDDNVKMTDQKGRKDKNSKHFTNDKIVKLKGQRIDTNGTRDHYQNKDQNQNFKQQQHFRLNTPLDVNSSDEPGLHLIQPNEFQASTVPNKLLKTLRISSNHKHSINTPNKTNQPLAVASSNGLGVDAFKENPRTTHSLAFNQLTKLTSSQTNTIGINNGSVNGTNKLEGRTKPEQWLDIRSGNNHPGLFIVIGVTFGILFILGLIQVYRCRKPSLYHHHRNHHYHQQNYDNHNWLNNYDNNQSHRTSYDRSLTHECEGSSSNTNNSNQYNNCNQFNNMPIAISPPNNLGIINNNGKRTSTTPVELQSSNVDDYYIGMNQETTQSSTIQSDLLPMELLCATPPTVFGIRPKQQNQQQQQQQQQLKQQQAKQHQTETRHGNGNGNGNGNGKVMDRVSVVDRSRFDVW